MAISDFPITMRLNKNSPFPLKEKTAWVMRHGGGIVAIYNEDLILKSLGNLGYPYKEACNFANDGCWEVQIPGKTDFTYLPFDVLQLFNEIIGLTSEKTTEYHSTEEIYSALCDRLSEHLNSLYKSVIENGYTFKNGMWQATIAPTPTSVISLFEAGCIKNARSYYDFGPEYLVRSPHIGGAPDVANSLYAIQRLVFEEKKITLKKLIFIEIKSVILTISKIVFLTLLTLSEF